MTDHLKTQIHAGSIGLLGLAKITKGREGGREGGRKKGREGGKEGREGGKEGRPNKIKERKQTNVGELPSP